MAANSIYETTFYSSHAEQVSVQRRYWAADAVLGNGASIFEVGQAMATTVGIPLKACLSSAATYRGVIVRQIWPTVPTYPTLNVTNNGVGGVAGDILPRQVRGIITLTTDFSGRRYRGRVYVPFPSEASNDADGSPTVGYVLLLGALGTALSDPIAGVGAGGNTETLTPTLVRITYTQHVITNVTRWAEIKNSIARDRWATQRRSGSYGQANPAVFW